jgi:uncharacterized membrane protein
MEKFIRPARVAYCIGLTGMVFPQFFYKVFGSNFFPAWPHLPLVSFWACLFTVITIAACIAIVFEKKARAASLILGGLLLAMYCFGYVPYEIILAPYNNYLGAWADGLKEPALAGGAFVIAGSFSEKTETGKASLIKVMGKLIPFGRIFFSITMILYGYVHFLYTKPISTLVPGWIPGHVFWTYFAGAMLICSGIAIIFRIKLKLVATLLGTMIFIWLIILHTPLAVADPFGNKSNSLISAFSALAFSGIAFVIAGVAEKNVKRV